jgi:hypothetical protein
MTKALLSQLRRRMIEDMQSASSRREPRKVSFAPTRVSAPSSELRQTQRALIIYVAISGISYKRGRMVYLISWLLLISAAWSDVAGAAVERIEILERQFLAGVPLLVKAVPTRRSGAVPGLRSTRKWWPMW